MTTSLKYEHIQIGTRIRAYDFEPFPGRTDRYAEGVITDTVTMTCGAKAFKVTVDVDTLPGAPTRRGIYVPMETDCDEDWETDRVQVIKPKLNFTSARAYRDYRNAA